MRRYKVSILPSAYEDLQTARMWYRQRNPELPKRLTQQVRLSISRISDAPFAYAIRYNDVRIANVNIFPYAVHYLVKEDSIIVLAIHHTAISPERWNE